MKLYKSIITSVLIITAAYSCSSCSMFGFDRNNVEPFGNVDFADSGLIGCINWLYYGDELYYYISSLDCKVEYDKAIGAFNDSSHGYTLYSLKGEEYNGITVLEYKSMMDTIQWVYASENVELVPCSMLFDVPHVDSFFNGGGNFTLNDITYSNYYSTESNTLEKGEEVGSVNNTTYYSILGYDDWICSVNEADNTRLNLCYSITMTNLPMYFVKLVNPLQQ